MDLVNWNDARLDAAFKDVHEDIGALREEVQRHEQRAANRDEARRLERKADLRWIVVTIIGAVTAAATVVGVIVAISS